MSSVDDQIRDALQAEHDDLVDEDEDFQVHFDSIKTLFRGRTKWFTFLQLIVMCAFCTMMVVCAVQFFRVETTREMIAWATGFAVFLTAQCFAELYLTMEINRNVYRRDIKRLELRIAALADGMTAASEQPAAETQSGRGSSSLAPGL